MSLGLGGTVVARARAVLEADTRLLDAGLAKAETRFGKFNKAAVAASAGIAIAFVEGAAKSIEAAGRYQTAMELIHTQAGKSEAEVRRMSKALLELAPKVATGPEELAKGLYHVESAGYKGAKALKITTAAAKGAKLGQADLEDVTNALNATVVSGIKGVNDYESAMGALNATVGAGDMRMQDLADAMGTGLAAKAKLFRLNIQDVDAALAVFGDNNIRGAEAGTLLASAIRLMGAPSKNAAKELATIGLQADSLGKAMAHGGLPAALDLLTKKMKEHNLTASEIPVFLARAFGGRQSGGIQILMTQIERLKQKEEDVRAGAEHFGKDWAAYQKTAQYATEQFHAEVGALQVEVGNKLLPTFTKGVRGLTEFLQWTDKNSTAAKVAAGVLGGFAVAVLGLNAAFKIYKATVNAAKYAQAAFNAVCETNPVILITTAIIALGIALVEAYKHSETFRRIVQAVFEKIRAVVGAVVDFIRRHWEMLIALIPGIGVPLLAVIKHWDDLKNGAKDAVGVVIRFVHMFRDAVVDMYHKVAGPLDKVIGFFSKAKDFAGSIAGGVKGGISKVGGILGGLGDGLVSSPVGISAGKAPRKDVTPGLWDELAIAEAAGLTITSTYRPGAISASGGPSLHGMFPSHAFDSSDGSNAGFGSPRMRSVFEAFIGRPGVSEVILSPYWWHPGAGIGRITNSAIMKEHFSHVHVGSVSGDGVVGRGGGRFAGDGLVGAKKRPKKPPKRTHKPSPSRYSKARTGESKIDAMIARYNRLDQDRSNAEQNYSTTQDELALNDPKSFTKTVSAVDPVTGLSYTYDVVDMDAVNQEAGDEDKLIALQAKIRAIVVQMQDLARKIANAIVSTTKKLRGDVTANRKSAKSVRERIAALKRQIAHTPKKKRGPLMKEEAALEKQATALDAQGSDLSSRLQSVSGTLGEWKQNPVSLGFDLREIDVQLAQLAKDRAGITGTTADAFDLNQFRSDNGWTQNPDGSWTNSSSSAPAATAEEIAAQLAAEKDAIVAARGRFVSEFASDVFSPGSDGKMNYGSTDMRKVEVHQHFTSAPEDPFVWFRKSEFAAASVFGG